jgi:hypothetical protein
MKNYQSGRGRPITFEGEQQTANKGYGESNDILLAYTSTDRKKFVKIQSNWRGYNTRKRIYEGN